MCFRKAAGVVPLLQGLTKVQIAFHSRFAAKMDFDTSHLARISHQFSSRGTQGAVRGWTYLDLNDKS